MYRVLIFLFVFSFGANAQKSIQLGMTTGGAYNVPGKMVIAQNGQPDIEFNRAVLATEAMKGPIYWDLLGEYHQSDWLFGLHFMHHKLVLQNEHPLLDRISITHGYNIFNAYVGKSLYKGDTYLFDGIIGGGVAFSHPEGMVRGTQIKRSEGIPLLGGFYDISYPNFEIGIQRDFDITEYLCVRTAFKSTYFRGEIETLDGYIFLNTLSFHGNIGLLGRINWGD